MPRVLIATTPSTRATSGVLARTHSWLNRIPEHRVQAVRFAVVDRDVVAVRLGHAVRRAGVERRLLVLRRLADLAEHLARRRLVEARLRAGLAHRLEHPGDADAGELGRQRRLDPRHRDERHRGEVVDLVRPAGAHRVDQRALVEQVALVQRDPVAQVLDALEPLGRGAAHHPVHLVALLEQQLGQVRAVLARDPGDQRAAHPGQLPRRSNSVIARSYSPTVPMSNQRSSEW